MMLFYAQLNIRVVLLNLSPCGFCKRNAYGGGILTDGELKRCNMHEKCRIMHILFAR